MHPENPHRGPYNFDALSLKNARLEKFVFLNQFQNKTIDFADPEAVFQLNKSLLMLHYKLEKYNLPEGYLCPAVPGRADYLCHLNAHFDLDNRENQPRVLDIGVGANCIYSIIGAQYFDWKMVGVDIHETSFESAKKIVSDNELGEKIEIRHQEDNAKIFIDIIREEEFFDFTVCNPPFYTNEKDAQKSNKRKRSNLLPDETNRGQNFGGKANELWCNGGEALFIKRMIKQSVLYKKQVGKFTTLVSQSAHVPKLMKQLDKLGADHTTIEMNIGNKKSRILIWWFA